MAYYDHSLEYQIKEAQKLIANLPEKDRLNVEAYIQNINAALERERKDNKEMREVFAKIIRFGGGAEREVVFGGR